MSEEDVPDVVISCDDCGTRTTVPLTQVSDSVDEHNDLRHDGDEVAGIDEDFLESTIDVLRDEILQADSQEGAADV